MKNIFKLYLLSFFLLSDFVMFAEVGDDDGGGGIGGEDPAPAPINSKLILLAIMGILFVFYTFRKNKKTI
jgi:hypothetical protein